MLTAAVLLAADSPARAGFVTFDVPSSNGFFAVGGVSGSTVVGYTNDPTLLRVRGFSYDGTAVRPIDPLTQADAVFTMVHGVDGETVSGQYADRRSGGTRGFVRGPRLGLRRLQVPGAINTYGHKVDGSTVVGYYQSQSDSRFVGFIYDGETSQYRTIDVPGGGSTYALGVDGATVVGFTESQRGFVYNGSTYRFLDVPGGTRTRATDASEGLIVGHYTDTAVGRQRGFIYDGISYTPFDVPGATATAITGIDGTTIVGQYSDAAGVNHGFVFTPGVPAVPEPASVVTLAVGAAGLAVARRRGRSA